MTAASDAATTDRPDLVAVMRQRAGRNAWTLALLGIFVGMLVLTKLIQPNIGAPQLTGLAIGNAPGRACGGGPDDRRDLGRD